MITNKNNLQCLCVWWFVHSFISNSQSIFFISTSRLLQRIQWPNWSEIYWKKNYFFFLRFCCQPTHSPSPPLFFCRCERIAVGRQLYFMVLFSPEPLVSVPIFLHGSCVCHLYYTSILAEKIALDDCSRYKHLCLHWNKNFPN